MREGGWISYYLRRDKDGSGYESIAFSETQFDELSPKISADGRFVAYESNESGSYEVYVQPFPEGPVTYAGFVQGWPAAEVESGRQRNLLCRRDALIAVPVSTTPTFSAGRATLLFQGKGCIR